MCKGLSREMGKPCICWIRAGFPAGKFYVKGPVVLKSGVNLHISEGTELIFSSAGEGYLPAVFILSPAMVFREKLRPNVLLTSGKDTVTYAPSCDTVKMAGKGKQMDNMRAELNKA